MGRTFGQHAEAPPTGATSAGPLGTNVSLKEGHLQLVTNVLGDIDADSTDGFGLYLLDTRFLSQFELRINGRKPLYLSHSADRNYIATFQFVNHSFTQQDDVRVPRQTISIRRSRFVDSRALHERIGLYNCNHFPVDIDLSLAFDADFADIFAVRGFAQQQKGIQRSVHLGPHKLTFGYNGRDGIRRRTVIEYDREPEPQSSNSLLFHLHLEPHIPTSITLRVNAETGSATRKDRRSFDTELESLAAAYEDWHRGSTSFETNNELFDRSLLRQSRLDLRALLEFDAASDPSHVLLIPDAGIPWYAVPFGRDSIITALQTLSYNPRIAEGTLRFLASLQGTDVDSRTEQEPGKILHEMRRGELANLREIPHTPYYGTVDATPLFLVLFSETMRWLGTSDLGNELYSDLLPHVIRALEWCDRWGDLDGDGYVEYRAGQSSGVINQGWKDSFDSLQYPDGTLGRLPAALVEVQGYVYAAKQGLGSLLCSRGDFKRGQLLLGQAETLKAKFNRDFWMAGEGFLAQALDSQKAQIGSITSNAGHALWAGILDEDHAERVASRLLADDMFSGWGIRTLSSNSPNYNPMSYHNGSIWPHDNSLIAQGMRRYGFDRAAARVTEAVISAGLRFPSNRLPELFCGFPRDMRFNSSPVAYVVSCSPQAWAAAAPFLFIQTLLGLEPNGGSITVAPIPTNLFFRYRVVGLHVGAGRANFEVHLGESVSVRRLDGDVTINSECLVSE